MTNLLKKGKGEGDVLDSTPSRPVWWIPCDNYEMELNLKRFKRQPTNYFSVLFCLQCRTAYEFFYSENYKNKNEK